MKAHKGDDGGNDGVDARERDSENNNNDDNNDEWQARRRRHDATTMTTTSLATHGTYIQRRPRIH
jgi:hypothetical protein